MPDALRALAAALAVGAVVRGANAARWQDDRVGGMLKNFRVPLEQRNLACPLSLPPRAPTARPARHARGLGLRGGAQPCGCIVWQAVLTRSACVPRSERDGAAAHDSGHVHAVTVHVRQPGGQGTVECSV